MTHLRRRSGNMKLWFKAMNIPPTIVRGMFRTCQKKLNNLLTKTVKANVEIV